jgi:hypothetical protein
MSNSEAGKSIICSVCLALDVLAMLVYIEIEHYCDAYPTLLFKCFMIYMFYQIDWTNHDVLKWIWTLFVGLMAILSIGINIYAFSNIWNPYYGNTLILVYTRITEIYDIYHLFFLTMCSILVIFIIYQKNYWTDFFNIFADFNTLNNDATRTHGLIQIAGKAAFIISIISSLIQIIEQIIQMFHNSYNLPKTMFFNHHHMYTRRAIQILYALFLMVSLGMRIQFHLLKTEVTDSIEFKVCLLIIHIILFFIDDEYKNFAVILFSYLSIIFIWHTRRKNVDHMNFPGVGIPIG